MRRSERFKEALDKPDYEWLKNEIPIRGICARLSGVHIEALKSVLDESVLSWLNGIEALRAVLRFIQGLPEDGRRLSWIQALGHSIEYRDIIQPESIELIHDWFPSAFDYIDRWEVQTSDRQLILKLCAWSKGDLVDPFYLATEPESYDLIYEFADQIKLEEYLQQCETPRFHNFYFDFMVLFSAAEITLPFNTFKVMYERTIEQQRPLDWARDNLDVLDEQVVAEARRMIARHINNLPN